MSAISRVTARSISQLMILCTAATGVPQSSGNSVILARDVDKRPLPKVSMAELSPGMRRKVQALIDDARATETPADKNRATAPSLGTTIYRIPVAPKGHRLYYIQAERNKTCNPETCRDDIPGSNLLIALYDETDAGLDEVVKDIGDAIDVVRRPHLRMPDIAVYDRVGRSSESVVVYRYDSKEWRRYLCKEIDIAEDPYPVIIADQPCD